jgi:hypothetical protein
MCGARGTRTLTSSMRWWPGKRRRWAASADEAARTYRRCHPRLVRSGVEAPLQEPQCPPAPPPRSLAR